MRTDDVREVLRRHARRPDGARGMTVGEIAAAAGLGRRLIRATVSGMRTTGELVVVGHAGVSRRGRPKGKRYAVDPGYRRGASGTRAGSKKACGNCGGIGHNVRTCGNLKTRRSTPASAADAGGTSVEGAGVVLGIDVGGDGCRPPGTE